MPAQRRAEKAQKEGRKLLALQALQKGQISSTQRTVQLYNMFNLSLYNCIHGHTPHTNLYTNNHKLTKTKELTLIQWILLIDKYSYLAKIYTIRKAAELLLK